MSHAKLARGVGFAPYTSMAEDSTAMCVLHVEPLFLPVGTKHTHLESTPALHPEYMQVPLALNHDTDTLLYANPATLLQKSIPRDVMSSYWM